MKQSHIADCIEQNLSAPQPYVYIFEDAGVNHISLTTITPDHPGPAIQLISPEHNSTAIGVSVVTEAFRMIVTAHQPYGGGWAFGVLPRAEGPFPGTIETTIKDYRTVLTITSPHPMAAYHG